MLILAIFGVGLIGCTRGASSTSSSSSNSWNYNYEPYPNSCNYHGKYGPYCWTSAFSTCGDDSQSPINIAHAKVNDSLHRLDVTAPACQSVKMFNDGHAYEIELHDTCPTFGVHYGDSHYHLENLEFHAPSEHTIGSSRYAAEMQLVHKDSSGKYLIVSVLMDSSLDELGRNNFIDYMWGLGTDFHDGEANSIMVDIKHYNTLTSVSALSLDRQINPYEELLPASPAYFAYQGSLTSPPCTEGVEWVVMAEPIGISTSQVDYFTFAMSNVTNATNYPQYSHHKSKYINSRPIKPLGTRTVSFYAGIGHSSHSSHDDHHEDPWYTPMIMPLGDAFAFFGILIMLAGGATAAFNFLVFLANRVLGQSWEGIVIEPHPTFRQKITIDLIRKQIAKSIVVSLEALVASDVIETLAKPVHSMTFTQLGLLSVVVAIRTVLSFHLNHDLHSIDHAIHQMRKDEHEHIEAKQEHKALLKMLTASEANLPKIDENDNNDEDDKRPNPELGRKSEAGSLVLFPRSSSGTAAAASGKEVELKQLKSPIVEGLLPQP
mmetsp:Transcript_8842/g.14344  ORF Transcript_8842/g.14344 Transcript_8842/m.14344 type:complete len:546 (-) Transcript_8842:484-2121(-)